MNPYLSDRLLVPLELAAAAGALRSGPGLQRGLGSRWPGGGGGPDL